MAPSWPRGPWRSCAGAPTCWRLTLSAEPAPGAGGRAGRAAEPAGAAAALRADGVTAGYGADPVIRGITVRVAPGEVVSVVGPNGSGKSTLVKSLAGGLRITGGTRPTGRRLPTHLH